jgi:CRISPR-associated protein Cmr1
LPINNPFAQTPLVRIALRGGPLLLSTTRSRPCPKPGTFPTPRQSGSRSSPSPTLGRSYAIELITPLFGGGVETRVNDPSFPIRATSIRGQLQFWWRATVGAQYATRQELRAAQSAIWGNTEQASKVQVWVEDVQVSAKPSPCARFDR